MKVKKLLCVLAAALALCSVALFAACSRSEADPAPETETVAVTGISFDKTELALVAGGTEKLTATVTPNNASNKTVTWTSDDESVATIHPDGTVTAVGEGVATITASAGTFTATCRVTVTAAQA